MIITKDKAIDILSFKSGVDRPTMLRCFKRKDNGAWEFWVDIGKLSRIPNNGKNVFPDSIKILAIRLDNTPNGNALLETYRFNRKVPGNVNTPDTI